MYTAIIKYIFIVLIIYLTGKYSYWWTFCIITFIMGIGCNSVKEAIFVNSFSAGSCWCAVLIYKYLNGGEILMLRISQMFGIVDVSLFIFLSTIIPIILGGLTGWSGYQLRRKND